MIALLAAWMLMSQPLRVACVGDSITFGIGVKIPSQDSYPARLAKMLGDPYRVGNFGESGSTMLMGTHLPYMGTPEYNEAKSFLPQIVVIKLGTNDANRPIWDAKRDEFVPTYRRMVEEFGKLSSHPKIYLCLPIPITYATNHPQRINLEEEVEPLVRQVAREEKLPIIDLYSLLDKRRDLIPDGLHPNEEGAQLVANEVFAAIATGTTDKSKWKIAGVDSEEADEGSASHAIDGNPQTYWHTAYSHGAKPYPHELTIDLGEVIQIAGVRLTPRRDGGVNGRIKGYEILTSLDGKLWKSQSKGELDSRFEFSSITLAKPVQARYLKLEALSEINGGPWASLGELDVIISHGGAP